MDLMEWLHETRTTMVKAGSMAGCAQSIISRIANRKHEPNPDTARRLVAMSGGEITMNELYSVPRKYWGPAKARRKTR